METLREANVPIDAILLQETWEIKYPTQLNIPGFQAVLYHTRESGRGGGRNVHQNWVEL